MADGPAKDNAAEVGEAIVPQQPEIMQPVVPPGVPDGHLVQVALVPLAPSMFFACDASGKPQQQMAASAREALPTADAASDPQASLELPAYLPSIPQAFLLPPEFSLTAPRASTQPAPVEPEQEPEQEAVALSCSTKRRLRRLRAAESHAQQPSDIHHAGDGASIWDFPALTAALGVAGEAREEALAQMRGSVLQLSTKSKEGSQLVQDAITLLDRASTTKLLEELHGHVFDLLRSPHGNFVLQKVVTDTTPAECSFIVRELRGQGVEAARHRYGCRVLDRLVEHYSASEGVEGIADLFEELLEPGVASDLCQHGYAHYVMELMLEHSTKHRPRIAAALRVDLVGNAHHKSASHVLEAALTYCSETEQQEMVRGLIGAGKEAVLSLARKRYGSYVLQKVLEVPCPISQAAREQLVQVADTLGGGKHEDRLLQSLGLGANIAE